MWPITESRMRAMLSYSPHFSEYDDQFDHGIVVLSYEGIEEVYLDLAKEFSKFSVSLDLTENEITDLSFLRTFDKLESLVLDKNRHLNPKSLPALKSLRLLWLNSCNIEDIDLWVEVIRSKCPRLKCLSLINNPGSKSLVNSSTPAENHKYRSFVARKLRKLQVLDEAPIERDPQTTKDCRVSLLSKMFSAKKDVDHLCEDSNKLEKDSWDPFKF